MTKSLYMYNLLFVNFKFQTEQQNIKYFNIQFKQEAHRP